MAKAWIELTGDQAGFGPSRVLIGNLAVNGYSAALWQLVVGKALILTGSKLTDDELRAIGGPPESWGSATTQSNRATTVGNQHLPSTHGTTEADHHRWAYR